MSTYIDDERWVQEYELKKQLLEEKRKRKFDEHHERRARWYRELDRVQNRIEELKAKGCAPTELSDLYNEVLVYCGKLDVVLEEEADWEKAKIDYLKNNFTEEERKMFEEYYSLEQKWLDVSSRYRAKCVETARSEAKDKLYTYVKQMLLIPGSIDRCKEYLERKLRKMWHIEEHKAYVAWIKIIAFDIEKAKELSAFTEEEKQMFDEYSKLEFTYMVNCCYRSEAERLQAEEAYEKAHTLVREKFNGSLDRCWDYLNKKYMTLADKEEGHKPYTPFIKDFSRKQ